VGPFTAGTTTTDTIWGSRGDNSSGIDAAPQLGPHSLSACKLRERKPGPDLPVFQHHIARRGKVAHGSLKRPATDADLASKFPLAEAHDAAAALRRRPRSLRNPLQSILRAYRLDSQETDEPSPGGALLASPLAAVRVSVGTLAGLVRRHRAALRGNPRRPGREPSPPSSESECRYYRPICRPRSPTSLEIICV